MEKNIALSGRGGKGGAGGAAPTEANDTLRSKQTVKILLAISEGEIEEVEQIYLNQIPIENFEGAEWDWRAGTATQTAISGFTETENPLPGFDAVQTIRGTKQTAENAPPGFVPNEYFASIPWDVDATRLTFSVTALRFITDEGNVIGYQIGHDIYTRPNVNATWTLVVANTKKGKASSIYAWDIRVNRPAGVTDASNWEIKVIRRTRDDPNSKYQSVSTWAAVTLIYDISLTYPKTALVSLILKNAAQFGGQVPEILLRVKGVKVRIPTNYDPVNHTYNENPPWNGSFTELAFHYTANPAWHLYDILHSDKGLGIAKADIDVYSLYLLSKFADQLVDDGGGTQERRYELHNQFYTRESAQTFLMYILSLCNANFTTNEFGQISVIFDRQGQAVTKQVTNANVVDGIFSYSSNELETRFSLVNVTYNNNLYYGRTDTATVSEDDLIARYGLQTSDIVLPGCTSQAQAIRKARWAIYTNARQTDLISFSLLFEGLTFTTGDLVRVIDNHNQNIVQSGRILAVVNNTTNTVLTLDRPVELEASSYTFTCLQPDGLTEIVKTIQPGQGSFSSLTISGVINPFVGGIFLISGATKARIYKVIKITSEENVNTVTGLIHDEAKYEYIDSGILLFDGDGDFVNYDGFEVPAVTNVQVEEFFGTNGVVTTAELTVSWKWDEGRALKYYADYKLSWNRDSGQQTFIEGLSTKSYDIANPVPGTYEITIWAVHPFTGYSSSPTTFVYNFRTEAGGSTLYPPINVRCLGRTDTIFNTPDMNLGFDYNPANNNVPDALFDYIVEVWNSSGLTLYKTYVVKFDKNKNGLFKLSFFENANLFGSPTRTFNVKIYSRDTMGDLSQAIGVQVSNPPPALTNWEIIPDFRGVYAKITPSLELDVKEYIIYKGDTQNFVANDGSIIYAGPDVKPFLDVPTGIIQYYALGIADTFGRDEINISTVQSAIALSIEIDTYVYTGLLFKPNDPTANKLSWTEGTATRNGTDTWAIAANPTGVLWEEGIMYIFYIPGTFELATSTSLVNAIAAGGRVIATYKGGTDITADSGKAFIDGDQILAGSIGATQLVANTAIITAGLQLGNVIESVTWSPSNKTGWKVDREGNIISYGSFELREAGTGNAIMLSGQFDWSKVTGSNIPKANADVTTENLSGRGINVLNSYYTFFPATLPDLYSNSSATVSKELNITYFGVSSLKVVASGADAFVYLGGSNDPNFKISPNKKWIGSVYVRSSAASKQVMMYILPAGGSHLGVIRTISAANTWTRLTFGFDLSAIGATSAILRLDNDGGAGVTMWFDGIMLEEQVGDLAEPSAYSLPGSSGALGQIDSITGANISTYIAAASIGTLFIGNDAITANTTYVNQTLTFTTPGATLNASVGNQVFGTSDLIIPSVDVATKRICIVTLILRSFDATPGYFQISLGGDLSPVTFTPGTNMPYSGNSNLSTYTAIFTIPVGANVSNLPFPLSIVFVNGPTSGFTWNNANNPTGSASIAIFTAKR